MAAISELSARHRLNADKRASWTGALIKLPSFTLSDQGCAGRRFIQRGGEKRINHKGIYSYWEFFEFIIITLFNI